MKYLGWCLAVSFFLVLSANAQAQNQSAPQAAPLPAIITLGQSIVPLYGPWQFHIGDNPRWTDPNFDDSQWETVDLTPKADSYDPNAGFSGYVPDGRPRVIPAIRVMPGIAFGCEWRRGRGSVWRGRAGGR